MRKTVRNVLKRTTKQIKEELPKANIPVRKRPLPVQDNVIDEVDTTDLHQERPKVKQFKELTITGARGKTYRVAVPSSYVHVVPKTWKWTEERYKVAEDIAEGIPLNDVARINGYNRMTIYGWLEHPEFREHVDGLILEGGMANRRERIATLSRIADMLVRKITRELDGVKLNEKSIGAVLMTIGQYAKHLAQEKEEFVEQSKIEQESTVNASVQVAHARVEDLLNKATEDERKQLEAEFDAMGDAIIQTYTGEKE